MMCIQSSSGGERRVKQFEHGWACSTDIENEAMTMEKTIKEKLTVNNLPKWGEVARSLIIPTTYTFLLNLQDENPVLRSGYLIVRMIRKEIFGSSRNSCFAKSRGRGDVGKIRGTVEKPSVSATGNFLLRLYYPGVHNGG
jgi:hypothetical protein